MANVIFEDKPDENGTPFSEVEKDTFFTADKFPAIGFDDLIKRLYFKTGLTSVYEMEYQLSYKVKTSDLVYGLNNGVGVEIRITDS